MLCSKCGAKEAMPDKGRLVMSEELGCDIPPGICARCWLNDPEVREFVAAMGERRLKQFKETLVASVRGVLGRGLDAVDRLVDDLTSHGGGPSAPAA